MKWFWIILFLLILFGFVIFLCGFFINWRIRSFADEKIKYSVQEIPKEDCPEIAIVYGARVYENGQPSKILYDRVFTAAELYKAGKVRKLLLSGARNRDKCDEPTAMKKTAIALGVAEEDIFTDFEGLRSFYTCYRAKNVYEIKRAVHVTQKFHLPRAIYLGENLGIESIGLIANRETYLDEKAWAKREFFAVIKAWLETNFIQPKISVKEKEPIE